VNPRWIDTDRLRMSVIESGPEDGAPVVLVHGNLSTGRFSEHLMPGAPSEYRLIAPDMRGFGDTERVPVDAMRDLRDWADDVHALLRPLETGRERGGRVEMEMFEGSGHFPPIDAEPWVGAPANLKVPGTFR
jgi:pimeloyl-ACP methyl ester carboxylesterase